MHAGPNKNASRCRVDLQSRVIGPAVHVFANLPQWHGRGTHRLQAAAIFLCAVLLHSIPAGAAACVSTFTSGGRQYLITDTTKTPPNCVYGVLFQNGDYGPLSTVVANPSVIQSNVTFNAAFLDLVSNQPTVDWTVTNFNTLDWYVQNRVAIETLLANNPTPEPFDYAKAAQFWAWGFSLPVLVYFWSWAAGEVVRFLRSVFSPRN